MDRDDPAQVIEALVHQYSKLVFHMIYGMTGQWQESQDLTQETFLYAFRGLAAARAKAGPSFQPKAWLMRIAVNTVRMASRRQRAVRFMTFADLQPEQRRGEPREESPPAEEMIQEVGDLETIIAERDVVQRCLDRLPATLRTPLLLSIVAGFSTGEIARMLDLKEATVRQRLVRARTAFGRLYTYESGEQVHIAATPQRRSARPVTRTRVRLVRQSAALVPARA